MSLALILLNYGAFLQEIGLLHVFQTKVGYFLLELSSL